MVWADSLLDAQEAARQAIEKMSDVTGLANITLAASSLAVCDEGGTGAESLKAAGTGHLGDSVVVEYVLDEIGGDREFLPKGHVSV